jgi:hypothetical protein
MITPATVAEIRRLLVEEGLSQRHVAQRTGVSRGTVHAIAAGKRPDYELRGRNFDADFSPPNGPLRRCPECGGMVHVPCLLCRVREMTQRHRHPERLCRHPGA